MSCGGSLGQMLRELATPHLQQVLALVILDLLKVSIPFAHRIKTIPESPDR
jgi:hypothetical protein